MPVFADSDIINYAVRMVVPMRREFGRKLDVQQFMRDGDYARQVVDEALTSQDARLREYATYVSQRPMSARIAVGPAAHGAAAATSNPAAPQAPDSSDPPAGDDKALRDRVLRKYTGGLR